LAAAAASLSFSAQRAVGRPRLLSVTTDANVVLLTRLDEIAPSAVELTILIPAECSVSSPPLSWRLPASLQSLTCTEQPGGFTDFAGTWTLGEEISALHLSQTLQRLDISGWEETYPINEELHAEGKCRRFPPR
jgi:hypothetical protein